MTEFEKIALLYLAHQSAMMDCIAHHYSYTAASDIHTRELHADILKVASPETLAMLGAVK